MDFRQGILENAASPLGLGGTKQGTAAFLLTSPKTSPANYPSLPHEDLAYGSGEGHVTFLTVL